MSLLSMHRQSLKREQGHLLKAQKDAAKLLERIADKRGSLASTKSSSRQQTLLREIAHLSNQYAGAAKNVAIYQGKVASYEAKVQSAEMKAQDEFSRQVDQSLQAQGRVQGALAGRIAVTASAVNDLRTRVAGLEEALLAQVRDAVANDPVEREHDLFLSYATPDEETAEELYAELTARKLDVWFSPVKRELGTSLTRQIDRGIASSRIGVVFITEEFLKGRYWPEMEMGAFFSSRKRVIPILVDVKHEALTAYSPILSDMVGLSTETEGFDEMAEQIFATLQEARAISTATTNQSAPPASITT